MRSKKAPKRGFTLIEMSVVMGIIAILVLVSIGGLLAGRANSMTNAAAEQLVTQIRDAQNRATSISADKYGNLPKGWGVIVDTTTNSFETDSYTDGTNLQIERNKSGQTAEYSSANDGSLGAVNYTVSAKDSAGNPLNGYAGNYAHLFVTYMPPYGTPYIYVTNGSEDNTGSSDPYRWVQSTKITREWQPLSTLGNLISRTSNPNDSVYVKISYQNATSVVVINSSGDVTIQ